MAQRELKHAWAPAGGVCAAFRHWLCLATLPHRLQTLGIALTDRHGRAISPATGRERARKSWSVMVNSDLLGLLQPGVRRPRPNGYFTGALPARRLASPSANLRASCRWWSWMLVGGILTPRNRS